MEAEDPSVKVHLPIRAKFTLGKLHSKYLILEILGFSDNLDKASRMLFFSSRSLKSLLI